MSEAFSLSGELSPAQRWWTEFGNAQLDSIVGSALSDNFGLRAAWERLRAAEALARREGAALYPSVDAFGRARRERPEGGSEGDSVAVGLAAEYEVDLWGRVRANARSAEFFARASREDYRAAALSLSAEIVSAWLAWVTAEEQLSLLQSQLEANRNVLDLIEKRFQRGQLSGVDVLRQRQLVEATREEIYLVRSRIQTLEHLVMTLSGRAPQDSYVWEAGGLPELPPLPTTGVASSLTERRPDLRASALALAEADADLARAAADRLPRFNLGAEVLSEGGGFGDLFEDWIRTVSADALAPLFSGGARSAEVDRARALVEQRLAEYGQSVLNALREVEDALVLEYRQRQRVESLRRQVELAEQSYGQLRVEYFNGVGSYIDVLSALTDLQATQRELLGSRLALLEHRVSLYRSLSGGFETSREREEDS